MIWIEYKWEVEASRPPKPDRYLIYRPRCKKMHFERWNGSGWSSTMNEEILWTKPIEPNIVNTHKL
jgi:hypothetical protein